MTMNSPSQYPFRRAGSIVLNAIFPPRCAACRVFNPQLFCARCCTTLQPIQAPFCACCGLPFDPLSHAIECADCRANRYHRAPPFEAVRSVYAFAGALRPAVYNFKYRGKIALAKPLAALLLPALQNDSVLGRQTFSALCPVPLHSWRRWRRGYNQSALLAEQLGAYCGVRSLELLKRTRRTPPQVGLNEKQRLENMRGAFAVHESNWHTFESTNGPVLLIDDVCTTGATLAECARVLKAAGVPAVYGLTLARQL